MAGLRDLFGKFEQVTLSEINGGAVDLTGYEGKMFSMDTFCHATMNGPTCCDAYCANRMCYWCMPAGTTTATFEIWGGGGGGAGMRGCHGGTPGGSGAWATKKITSTDFSDGDCYFLCSGNGGRWCCCRCIGCQGCKSFVTGNGLDNFCADGGFGGYVYCFCYIRQCCISGPNGDGRGVDYGWHYMGRSGCCSAYYGADEGEYGLPGWYTNYCGCGSDCTPCWVKQWVPNSPGMSAKGGMHNGVRVQGWACNNEWTHCQVAGVGTGHYNMPRAGGGVSMTTCGDGTCCGNPGNSGMVRVIYK